MRRLLPSTAMLLTLIAACGTDVDGAAPGPAPSTVGGTSAEPSPGVPPGTPTTDRADVEEVAERFVAAANAGDDAALAALFAPDARFDSVGRIYPSRDDIMARFLVPEVLRVGGRYEPVERRWNGERLTVTYRFSTASGGREEFSYAYLVRDGLIRDVVGRYL